MDIMPPRPRHGMTVLELLIVVMILGLLAVVVLPTLNKSMDSRRYREAARNVSSFIARSQVRALDAREPKGFMIQPLAADPAASIEMFFADTPPAYCGESTRSSATINPATNGSPAPIPQGATTLPVVFDRDDDTATRLTVPGFVRFGDAIRFNTSGPEFCFVPSTNLNAQPHRIMMWADNSQTVGNTPWPRGSGVPFRIHRRPTRASTGVLQLQRSAAIDVAWSCIGTRPLFAPGVPPQERIVQDIAEPVVLLFDASGKPQHLVHSGGIRTVVAEPLFLLIGSSELAGNDYLAGTGGAVPNDDASGSRGANWQYSDAVWLCVDNHTGVVKFAPIAPQATTVIQSQRFVRMTIALGTNER